MGLVAKESFPEDIAAVEGGTGRGVESERVCREYSLSSEVADTEGSDCQEEEGRSGEFDGDELREAQDAEEMMLSDQ